MIHFAIVGCGHVAKKHALAIQESSEANLFAVCDTDSERLTNFLTIHKAQMFTNFEQLLQEKELHVVNICTPSGTHAKLAIQAAEAKKHIVLEKPMALTLKDATEIIEACKRHNVKLTVVHPNRFRPAIIELRQAINQGMFGKMSHINATLRWNRNQEYYNQASWRGTKNQDGGVLMNQAIHNLDLFLWLGGEVDNIQAYTDTRIKNIEVEDVAVAIVRFKDGKLGVIEASSSTYPRNYEESISLFGEHGTVKIGGPTANWIKHWDFKGVSKEDRHDIVEKINSDPFGVPGHHRIIQDMILAIKENRDPLVTGEDGKKALALVLAIYDSASQNKPSL